MTIAMIINLILILFGVDIFHTIILSVVVSSTISLIIVLKLKQLEKKEINKIVSLHIEVLTDKYKQFVYEDDYGKLHEDKWYKEIKYFISTQLPNTMINEADLINIIYEGVNSYLSQKRLITYFIISLILIFVFILHIILCRFINICNLIFAELTYNFCRNTHYHASGRKLLILSYERTGCHH